MIVVLLCLRRAIYTIGADTIDASLFIVSLPKPYVVPAKHTIRGSDELMDKAMLSERNLSVRMTEITAAVIRPLLANLPERSEQFSRRYHEVRTTAK